VPLRAIVVTALAERPPYYAHALVLRIYAVTESWPASERYGLSSQIRRAAVSVPTNLAEGVAKPGSAELRRYVNIAIGSRSELKYLLRLASDLGYVSAADGPELSEACEEVGRLLWGLCRSLRPAA
jgi:four helix bundle protein